MDSTSVCIDKHTADECLDRTVVHSASEMSGPRRRVRGNQDNELVQSLLDEQDTAPVPSAHNQLVVQQHSSLEAFITAVIQSWLEFLSSLRKCWQAIVGGGGNGVNLSLIQAERLEELQERLHVPFDISNHSHQQQLQELWSLAFPGMAFTNLKNDLWKDMGWQGDDPTTDFRAAGLFGLDNLVYMGTHHPRLFQQLRHKTQGVRAQWEYPFAAAGINLTYELTDLLGMSKHHDSLLPTTPAGVAFCELLRESDTAFEELYCSAYALLDRLWLERKASYMEFSIVMKEVKSRLTAVLHSKPKSIQQVDKVLNSS